MFSLNFSCVTPQDGLCEPPVTLGLILVAAPPPLTPIGCNRPELRGYFFFLKRFHLCIQWVANPVEHIFWLSTKPCLFPSKSAMRSLVSHPTFPAETRFQEAEEWMQACLEMVTGLMRPHWHFLSLLDILYGIGRQTVSMPTSGYGLTPWKECSYAQRFMIRKGCDWTTIEKLVETFYSKYHGQFFFVQLRVPLFCFSKHPWSKCDGFLWVFLHNLRQYCAKAIWRGITAELSAHSLGQNGLTHWLTAADFLLLWRQPPALPPTSNGNHDATTGTMGLAQLIDQARTSRYMLPCPRMI